MKELHNDDAFAYCGPGRLEILSRLFIKDAGEEARSPPPLPHRLYNR